MFVRVSFKNVPGAQKTFADKQNLKRQIAESSACNMFGDLPPLLHRPGYGLVSSHSKMPYLKFVSRCPGADPGFLVTIIQIFWYWDHALLVCGTRPQYGQMI